MTHGPEPLGRGHWNPKVHIGAGELAQLPMPSQAPGDPACVVQAVPAGALSVPHTPAAQVAARQGSAGAAQSLACVHIGAGGASAGWQASSEPQKPEQHSAAWRHGAASARQEGPASKSTVTGAAPAGSMLMATATVCPCATVANTGTLTQVGVVLDVTSAHAPANADPSKRTVPVGMPGIKKTLLWPFATSNDWLVLRSPVAVIWTQPTVPSSGTLVIATAAEATSSPGPDEPEGEQPAAAWIRNALTYKSR
jgi:hypothetical protein